MRPSIVPLCLATLLLLCACGGGGGGGGDGGGGGGGNAPPPSPAQLEGVVSVGAPLANARVQVADAQGNLLGSATAQASDGRYRLTLSKPDPALPLLVQAQGEDAGGRWQLLHSLVSSAANGATVTAHVTPLTQASAALALGADPRTLFARSGDATLAATTAAVAQGADALLKTVLKTSLTDLKLGDGAALNLQTDAGFAINKSGADLLLEAVRVGIEPAQPARLQLGNKFLITQAVEVEVQLGVARSELLKGSSGSPASAISSALKVTSAAGVVLGNAATMDGLVNLLNPLLAQGADPLTLQTSNALVGYEGQDGRSLAELATLLAAWGQRGLQLGPLQILGCADEVPKVGDCLRVEVASSATDRSGQVQDRLIDTISYSTRDKRWSLIGNGKPLAFSVRALSWLRLDAAGAVQSVSSGNPAAGVEVLLQSRAANGTQLIVGGVVQTPLGYALPLSDCDESLLCIAGPGGVALPRQASLLDRLLQPGVLGWLGGADALRGARYSANYTIGGSNQLRRAYLGAPAVAQAAARHPVLDGVSASAPLSGNQLRAGLAARWSSWAASNPDARLVELQIVARDGNWFQRVLAPADASGQQQLPPAPDVNPRGVYELWLLAVDTQGRRLATRYSISP